MIKTKNMLRLLLLTLAVSLASLACYQEAADDKATDAPQASAAEPASPVASETEVEGDDEVEFVPAYPTEVSKEDLSDEDVAQQTAPHSHGDGEEHSHGADTHGTDDGHDEEEKDEHHDH